MPNKNEGNEIIERARTSQADIDVLYEAAELLKVFGDSTRISILSALSFGEMGVTDLAELLNMTISAISHQLRILRGSKLVRARRQGKEVFYSLADTHVVKILEMAIEHVKE